MIKANRQKFSLGLLLFTALFSLVPTAVFAAGDSVYLTPPSGTSQPGNTFTVSADGNVGSSWFGTSSVSGTITFPANLLKVNAVSSAGATFNVSSTVTPDNANGTISFNQYTNWWTGANNQTVHLFTVTFQSLANGTAPVNFSNVQYNTGAAAMAGGTYTVSTPPPPPTPSPSPSPSPAPKPSSTPKPAVTPKPSPVPTPSTPPTVEETPAPVVDSDGGLKIENVKIIADRAENSVTWTVSNPAATPVLTYGTTKNGLKSDGIVSKQDDGSYSVVFTDLKPGALYYFMIKAATADNLQGATYSGVLTTRGYPIQLTIEQNNLLLPGAKVKIGERIFVANKNAIVTTELGDGSYTAIITGPGSTESHNATFVVVRKTIPKNGNPALQSFVLNATTVGTSSGLNSSLIPTIIGGAVAVMAAIGGIIGLFILRRKKAANDDAANADTDLLAASYGDSVDELRNNTPLPNLDTAAGVSLPPMDLSAEPEYQTELPPEQAVTAYQPADDMALTAEPVAPVAVPFDPAALPLPPTVDPAMPIQQQYADEPTVVSQPDYQAEQLSQAVSQVESSEQITDDEPSAVYDEATGELDIIHHHADEGISSVPIVETVAEIPQEPLTQPDVTPMDTQPVVDVVATEDSAATQPYPITEPQIDSIVPVDQTPEQPEVPLTQTPITALPQ